MSSARSRSALPRGNDRLRSEKARQASLAENERDASRRVALSLVSNPRFQGAAVSRMRGTNTAQRGLPQDHLRVRSCSSGMFGRRDRRAQGSCLGQSGLAHVGTGRKVWEWEGIDGDSSDEDRAASSNRSSTCLSLPVNAECRVMLAGGHFLGKTPGLRTVRRKSHGQWTLVSFVLRLLKRMRCKHKLQLTSLR